MGIRKVKSYIPVIAAILILGAIAVFSSVDLCVFRRITGLPCPSCGMTRAYISLFKGDISGAFLMHPLFPLVPVIAALVIIARYKKKHFTWLFITFGVIFIVTYIIRMIFLFPHTPPFDYEYSSILGRLLFP